ncbi:MAG TPA: DUF302 domain-containing protein [Steroidobacteraceae bacterium]|nr:DUF302 domain-containing protein [Steroidobacteraceae bacterium]
MTTLSDVDTHGVVTIKSRIPFADTVQRLLAAFHDHGIRIFATIDQRAEAQAVGLSIPPTTLIIFGNPRAGTALMLANPQSGVDLPLKVLITESASGEVLVVFNAAAYIIQRHALPERLAANLALAEKLIAGIVGATGKQN